MMAPKANWMYNKAKHEYDTIKIWWTTWKQKKEKETSLAFSYTIHF